MLYEAETKQLTLTALLAELPVAPEEYALVLVEGVAASSDELASLVDRHAERWAIDRLPAVDRALLMIASLELSRTDVPTAVVIDEAVELAKSYSTEDSGRYVNGVLSAIAAELRPERL